MNERMKSLPRTAWSLVAGGAALILSVIAFTSWVLWTTHAQRIEETYTTLANLNLALTEQAAQTIRAADLILLSVLDSVRQQNALASPQMLEAVSSNRGFFLSLNEQRVGAPQIDALAIVDRDGETLVTTRGLQYAGERIGDRDYFRALKNVSQQNVYISVPYLTRGGDWAIHLARRLETQSGDFLGVVSASIELKFFEEFYKVLQIRTGGSLTLIRRDGVLLARYPRVEASIGASLAATAPFTEVLARRSAGTLEIPSTIDGKPRYMAIRALADYPLAIAVSVENSAVESGWRGMAAGIIAVAAILSVMICLLVWMVARLLRRQALQSQALEEAIVRAEAANRAKSAFLSTMSHELRTPLNAIIGFSELLREEVFGPIGNSRYVGYIADIHRSGAHLLNVINDVLDMSRLEAKAMRLNLEPVSIREAIGDACSLVRSLSDQKQLSLLVETGPNEMLVAADRRALHQILTNLLSNSIKFTDPGGVITISAKPAPTQGFFALSVADNGCGIPAEFLGEIGSPFVQVHDAYSGAAGGSGLGLSISRSMAEEMGGTLTIESVFGSGTTVTITLRGVMVSP